MTPEAPLDIRLLTRANGAGLSRDLALLADVLRAAGCRVSTTRVGHRSRVVSRLIDARLWLRRHLPGQAPRHDINVMLERIYPDYFDSARHNVLVPNPEWTREAWLPWLPRFDLVAVKTRHAVGLFEALGCPVRWIGFAGHDRLDARVEREPAFLHLPGRSNNKGTARLLELWTRHPEWPPLTVVWRSRYAPAQAPAANVTLLREYLDEAALRQLQNRCRFHLCPSQTEGYGHYIVETLSVGAVVISTDAAPMNELVRPEWGLLVDARSCGTQALATLYEVDMRAMEAAIERCLAMPAAECEQRGRRARAAFEQGQAAFPGRLLSTLEGVAGRPPQHGP